MGLRLFARDGYDATTMEAIAAAAGISRPTLFRYFPAKKDIVWDRYDQEAEALRAALAAAPPDGEPLEVLCDLLPGLLRYAEADLDLLRIQVTLIETVPDALGHMQVKLATWLGIVSAYVAERSGTPRDGLLPMVMSQAVSSAGWAALTYWAASDEPRPDEALRRAFASLRAGFTLRSLVEPGEAAAP